MIEIIELTNKGRNLARSVRSADTPEWRVIHFLDRIGGRSTKDKITQYVFNGNVMESSIALRKLKSLKIITGETGAGI